MPASSARVRRLPVHPQSRYIEHLERLIAPGTTWLDVGCGRQIAPPWAWSEGQEQRLLANVHLTGLDVDDAIEEHPHLHVRLRGKADRIDAADAAFDLVTANMVMEHVDEPGAVLREIHRVLRPGGRFLVHTPNRRHYLIAVARRTPDRLKTWIVGQVESRHASDVFPAYYRFNTPEEIRALSRQAGFLVEDIQMEGPYPAFWQTPLAPLEKPVLWLHGRPWMRRYRSNLIVTLRKP